MKAIIGVHDWERTHPQELIFTIHLGFNTRPAGFSDQLKDTVDYDALSQRLISFVETSRYELIETLAEACASIILNEFKVSHVMISLQKPGAVQQARTVEIQITRSK